MSHAPSPADPPDAEGADPARRTATRGTDVDHAVAFYAAVHNAVDVRLGLSDDHPFSFRFRAVGSSDLVVRSSRVASTRHATVELHGRSLLTWTQGGRAVFDPGTADEHVLEPGVPAMYPAGRPFVLDTEDGVVLHAVDMDTRSLERLHAERRPSAPRSLRFRATPGPSGLASLRRMLRDAAPVLLDEDALWTARAGAAESVRRAVLDAFADDTVREPDRLLRYPPRVRSTLRFIAEHCAEPLTSSDLAAAAGLSERGLQQAFARSGLEAPMVELRNARLDAVRDHLAMMRPRSATIASVARRWRFGHLGRFSGYYVERHGEYPKDTLRATDRSD